jgi:hypothetical protein
MREYKIDVSRDWWWKYGVFRKETFLGLSYWHQFAKTDSLSRAREAVKEDMELPIYINEKEQA